MAHPFLSKEFHEMVKKAMAEIYLPKSNTWVYEKSGVIIGFISMAENEIGGLFVSPEHHGKGIGTSLLKHICQFHNKLEVEVFDKNEIAKPFYEKMGFKKMDEYIHEESNQKVLRMTFTVIQK